MNFGIWRYTGDIDEDLNHMVFLCDLIWRFHGDFSYLAGFIHG